LDELLQVAPREVLHPQIEIVLTLESKLESSGEGMRGAVGHGVEDVSLCHSLSLVGVSHILLADDLQSIELPICLRLCKKDSSESAFAELSTEFETGEFGEARLVCRDCRVAS
jgi:hypothetical protein